MSKRSIYSPEEKFQIIPEMMDRRRSVNSVAKKLQRGISMIVGKAGG